ncbi:MAG: hypothetical protein LQ343_003480 [Gyalolechia ehrenbergii]|nr:MAG: hypothetical protein LQ343_003480 [Gyalolechia ehrenbergii]
MWFKNILLISALFINAIVTSPAVRHVLHERRSLDSKWKRQSKLPGHVILPMRIGLAQQNLHRANEFLDKVSHPASADYGKHWTAEEVAKAFSASDEAVDAVKAWLSQNNIPTARLTHHHNSWLEVNVTTSEAEQLLRTEYFVHENEEAGEHKVACNEYWIPENLHGHIDFITPTVHFDTAIRKRRTKRNESELDLKKRAQPFPSPGVTPCPSCPPGQNPTDPKSYIGSDTCNKGVTPACVRALYGVPNPSTVPPFTGARAPLACLEFSPAAYSATDLELFFGVFTNISSGTVPRTVSIGGGLISASDPARHSIDDWDSGDTWEPNGDFQIAMAIVPNPEDVLVYSLGPNIGWENFLDALDSTYSNCTKAKDSYCGNVRGRDIADVISISWTAGEASNASPAWFERQCNEYMKLGLMGITVLAASGDSGVGHVCTDPSTGVGYADERNDTGLFTANFPASCPYVTAVGATAIPETPNFTPGMLEVAPWRAILSGGGFSNIFPAASYQASTMAAWHSASMPYYPLLEGKPRYNGTGIARGYPDISANGYQYSIYSQNTPQPFSGTSGSAPMVAGIIALINAERLAEKDADGQPVKGTVGFINPVLYAYPEILNDVVSGSNPGCGTPGFKCQKGWDPVTGLGTPNYAKMSAKFNSLP